MEPPIFFSRHRYRVSGAYFCYIDRKKGKFMSKIEILKIIRQIELNNNIEVVFACDIGSRALGYATENSDFDIRFIYTQNSKNYLTVNGYKDTIETKSGDYDFVGYDIKRMLDFCSKSNAMFWNMLYSNSIILDSGIGNELRLLSKNFFSQKSFLKQYCGVVYSRYKAHILESERVKIKYYLFIFVKLATAISVANGTYNKDNIIKENLMKCTGILPKNITDVLMQLLKLRVQGEEYTNKISLLDNYVLNTIDNLKSIENSLNNPESDNSLNEYFYNLIVKRIYDNR